MNMNVTKFIETQTQPLPTLRPAISPRVHLSLTITYTTLYGILFCMVYIQLWLILYYKHKRFSYQSVFLFLCLIWAGLRTTLFTFYFKNCILANNLPVFFYWLLYCFPVCLQFITLCLLFLFVAQVAIRAKNQVPARGFHGIECLWAGVTAAIIVFLATNVTCGVIARRHQYDDIPVPVFMVRVIINDSLFILLAVALSISLYKMSKLATSSNVLETKGLTLCQAVVMCVVLILLYTSRALYNMVAVSKPLTKLLSFGYGWINVSDQAENTDLDQGFAFVSFGVVLFLWEFLPTFVVVIMFRVHRPASSPQVLSSLVSAGGVNSKVFFFDNPRRYDSEDDLANGISSTRGDSLFDSGSPFAINAASPYSRDIDDLPPTPPIVYSNYNGPSVRQHPREEPQFYDGT